MSNIRASNSPDSSETGLTMAEQADRHVLYQESVQSPEVEIEFFEDRFKELRGRSPFIMREDFCGTAKLSTVWAKKSPKNRAIGVDICQDTLDWGIEHNIKPAGKEVAERVTLLNENVVDVETEEVDLICAMNFSYCIFKTRQALLNYFKNARKGLKSDGLLFLDLLGGTATMDVCEEERDVDGDISYVWDQAEFNPINNHMQCYIHFDFPDGSRLEEAFSYNWRLWGIPELHDMLMEAGFSNVYFYWEEFVEDEDDPDNDYLVGTGEHRKVIEVNQ